MTISWSTSKESQDLILSIAERVWKEKMFRDAYMGSIMSLIMDLTVTHVNGCPLKLSDMLTGLDCDVFHDIAGIFRHLDRQTGKLGGCFVPRYAQ